MVNEFRLTSVVNSDTGLDVLELFQKDDEERMGTIRCRSKCPSCKKPFKYFRKLGYACPECKTMPSRFYIDLWHQKERFRLFSDKSGQVLDSYQRATTLLSHINYEIQHHTFDPSKYVSSEIRKFLFEEQIATFLKEKEIEETKGNISPSYISSLKNYIKNYYLPFFQGKDVRDVGAIDIKDFYLQLPQRKEKTIKNILDALNHFFKTLHKFGIIEKVPIFPVIRVPESVPYWTSIENQLKLLDAISDINKPIFTFILFQAVRPSEARALKWKDIDLENQIVIIRRTFSNTKLCERTKGRNVKKREIHPFVLEVLQNLPRGLPEAFVFPNPNTGKPYSKTRLEVLFMKARKTTGINLCMYAAGRHSVLSQAGTAGVSPFIIKSYAGHSSIKSSEKYVHIDVLAQRQIFERTVAKLAPEKIAKE